MVILTLTVGRSAAVALAVAGAVLFGLASVRQHGAVRDAVSGPGRGPRSQLRTLRTLLRERAWLIGAVQATVAGAMHVVALALAPITLVQPIGVLAVPVTVVATSVNAHRRPNRRQVGGALASVVGIGVLTVLLITPSDDPVVLPPWWLVATTVVVTVGLTGVAGLIRAPAPALLRCVLLAGGAAVLFGLNSILLRMCGHIVSTGAMGSEWPLLCTAALGLLVALPVGLWAMQSAYLSGSPHVVICCLTLLDPLTAVGGGGLLLQDGVAVTAGSLLAILSCVVVATLGVILLSAEYPTDHEDPVAALPAVDAAPMSTLPG